VAFTREEIEDLLDGLPAQEFRFDKVQEDALTYVGALRTMEGQNVVEPSPESASMIIGLKGTINFLTAAPQVIKQLLDQTAPTKAPPATEKPKTTADEPISV
jgi:hypothetical protein